MKINLGQMMNRESWLCFARWAKKKVCLAGRWLLIQHSHALDITAVALVLVVVVYLVVALLYLAPPGVNKPPSGQLELATDVIDRLELWVEQRDAILSAGLEVPEGVL